MDKWSVARALDEVARYVELGDPNPFRARAFERAARAVEKLETDLARLVASGSIQKIDGIGKATGEIVGELVRTGRSAYLEELRSQYPAGIFELLRVPALGLKKVGVLHAELGVSTLEELEQAAADGRVAKLKGFGPKTAQKILEGIELARARHSKFLLPVGIEVGESLRALLANIDEVENAEVSGAVRRRLEVITRVEIVIATKHPDALAQRLLEVADDIEPLTETTYRGLARGEMEVLFHLAKPGDFGAAMLASTGSDEFLAAFEQRVRDAGFSLRNGVLHLAGRRVSASTEEALFERVGIPYVEPERRENGDDLTRKRRPKLVQHSDLRGTFHVHTTWSDGRNSMIEMLRAARDRGFEYVGMSDHSKAAYYAGGLTEEQLDQQHAEIARHEESVAPMRVFRGTEADILLDGSIDYGAEVLDRFDFVVASIHSTFKMERDAMTDRIVRALDDPHVTFLGHLTGRLLLSREGYQVDYERVFAKAAERGVIIEINGNPRRLDLDWRHIGRALDHGVLFAINPDAHSVSEYNAMLTGTWVARKGGLSPKHIFNTRDAEEVGEWLGERKRVAAGP
ncbi:MAG: DNA polymerase/3'-5' exonuclease PolX [Thermoanaerobaculia bacterium]